MQCYSMSCQRNFLPEQILLHIVIRVLTASRDEYSNISVLQSSQNLVITSTGPCSCSTGKSKIKSLLK